MIADRSKCLYCDSDEVTIKDNEYGGEYRCGTCGKLSTDQSFDIATEICTVCIRLEKGMPVEFGGHRISKRILKYQLEQIIKKIK